MLFPCSPRVAIRVGRGILFSVAIPEIAFRELGQKIFQLKSYGLSLTGEWNLGDSKAMAKDAVIVSNAGGLKGFNCLSVEHGRFCIFYLIISIVFFVLVSNMRSGHNVGRAYARVDYEVATITLHY